MADSFFDMAADSLYPFFLGHTVMFMLPTNAYCEYGLRIAVSKFLAANQISCAKMLPTPC